MSDVRAIFAADLHLQARPPVARASEPDWYTAMARPLDELRELQKGLGGVPIFYSGDIFDRWNSPPELINFALEHLPRGYAVPGQHDLPHHAHEEIHRSAYWTLVAAEHIVNLPPGEPFTDPLWFEEPVVYGFPWGWPLKPLVPMVDDYGRPTPAEGVLKVAVVHEFVWIRGMGYPGAPKEGAIQGTRTAWKGYNTIAFGDNHKGFITQTTGGPWVCNCGTFMRRTADEVDYRPGVGLVHADGSVTRHYLCTTELDEFTVYTDSEERVADHLDMAAFMEGLRDLEAGDALNFEAALDRFIRDNGVPERVARVILEAQEGG